jgi:ABC-type polar amino acid transport system ATPase subunit
VIRVDGLRKAYDGVPVLLGVDHRQAAGEAVVVIGQSGCGKSTFLRCLNLLEHADAGDITIGDVTVPAGATPDRAARERRRRLRRSTGMVFQQFNLFPHLSALGNVVEAPVHVAGMPRADATALGMELLAKVGLGDRADHLPSRLSGGQQQRVAIARALAMRPAVMLFDEPTSALDPEMRGEVLGVLRALGDEGMTMILVTHEMGFAREIADRVLFFDAGRVAESGPPGQVLDDPLNARTREFLRGGRPG